MKGLALNKFMSENGYLARLTYKGRLIKQYTMDGLIEAQLLNKDALPSIIYNDIIEFGLTEFTYEQIDNFLQGKS